MNDERNKPIDCYNFSKFRDMFNRNKLKRQFSRKNNAAIRSNKTCSSIDDSEDDIIVEDVEDHKEVVKRMEQNNKNGTKSELNKTESGRHKDDYKDYQLTNCLLKAVIELIESSRKKKGKHEYSIRSQKNPMRSTSFDYDFNIDELEESSPNISKSRSEDGLITPDDGIRACCINRTNSKRASRKVEVEERSGSLAYRNGLTKSGQIIMFSSSSGMLKPPPVEKKLECTLEELCYGCVKNVRVSRDAFLCTGQRVQQEEVLIVNVMPGWIAGTKVTFNEPTVSEEGLPSYPADVIFIITEKHHSLFRRIADDLELEIEIPLEDALTGCPLTIPLLGKEKVSMEIDDVVYPGYEVTIVGQGMPRLKNPDQRGSLKVKFRVDFPKLSDEQRSEVFRVLNG